MGNFNRERKFNDRRSGGGSFGRRDGGSPQMFRTTCSECGASCEVPFKPTGDKPVYCSECFQGKRDGGHDRERNDRGRNDRGRFGERSFGRSSFSEKRMFDAVCDECGDKFQLPFKPQYGKPVFCNNCFDQSKKSDDGGKRRGNDDNAQLKEQFAALNTKLDRILKLLLPQNDLPKVRNEYFKKEKSDKAVIKTDDIQELIAASGSENLKAKKQKEQKQEKKKEQKSAKVKKTAVKKAIVKKTVAKKGAKKKK
jgi:CxxC-x17-CxxC domain-containing protein